MTPKQAQKSTHNTPRSQRCSLLHRVQRLQHGNINRSLFTLQLSGKLSKRIHCCTARKTPQHFTSSRGFPSAPTSTLLHKKQYFCFLPYSSKNDVGDTQLAHAKNTYTRCIFDFNISYFSLKHLDFATDVSQMQYMTFIQPILQPSNHHNQLEDKQANVSDYG